MAKVINKLVESQEQVLKEIMQDYSEFEKDFESRKSRGYVQACLADVENLYKRARKDHSLIIAHEADPIKDKYFHNEIFSKIKRIFFTFCGLLNDEIDKRNIENPSSVDTSRFNVTKSSTSDIRLNRIHIPTFSGEFENWSEFHNLFDSLIHQNVDLSDIQKLQYLRTTVTGAAAGLIQHFPIDGSNYEAAWQILTDRFENKRKLVNTQLRIFMEQKKITFESSSGLKSLHDVSLQCINSLTNLGVGVETCDSILIYIVFNKLPPQTQRDWENKLGTTKSLPEWKQFLSFIESRFNSLENISEVNGFMKYIQPPGATSFRRSHATTFHANPQQKTSKFPCRLCKGNHGVRHCKQFISMEPKIRAETAKKHTICSNCLGYDHHASLCSSGNRCFKCGLMHHTLLHIDSQNTYNPQNSHTYQQRSQFQQQQPRAQNRNYNNGNNSTQNHFVQNLEPSPSSDGSSTQVFTSQFNNMKFKALLATALVKVIASNGVHHVLRALIDPGSEATFITENATQLLSLKRSSTTKTIQGLGRTSTGTCTSIAKVTLLSLLNDSFRITIDALVYPHIQLTSMLPTQNLPAKIWDHLSHLQLADPTYNVPGKIDILIGADAYGSIILEGLVKGPEGAPVAQLTELGWILTGSTHSRPVSQCLTVQTHFNSLDKQLKEFWEIEENIDVRKLSPEEEQCQQHFKRTVTRRKDGRYEVQFPFKNEVRPLLGDSKKAALARFFQIERRLSTNENLRQAYVACINEYVELGHMTEIHSPMTEILDGSHYFIPHHSVVKNSSTTTKVRVVFDASCKTSNGLSLNDTLMVGPRLQPDILDLVSQWRKFKVAMVADISMMYRQIWMAQSDVSFQLILWRPSTNQQIKMFKINTVTFGTASAPHSAVGCLQEIANEVKDLYPHVHKAILEGFYVDDFIYGSEEEEDAIRLQTDLINSLKSAGFPLRKWASNSDRVLEQVSKDEREVIIPFDLNRQDAIKTLGIQWHPAQDILKFKFELPNISKYTKRTVLADIARIFDPLGWISPCVVLAKLILQQLWLKEVSWDAPINPETERSWAKLRQELPKLHTVEIPRWINLTAYSNVQIHGFCDASERAYAAVIYVRVITPKEEHIHLLMSKTRVAPLKNISLPRLELCAALLLAKLLHRTIKTMRFDQPEIFAWSDSMIVLAWIKGSPTIRTTFVANRVAEIQTLTNPSVWRHVGTKNNPADICSRGLLPLELISNETWWKGPSFLKGFVTPILPAAIPFRTDLESKNKNNNIEMQNQFYKQNLANFNIIRNFSQIVSNCVILNSKLFHRYSTLNRLIRTTAIWRRYIFNKFLSNPQNPRNISPISTEELISANKQLIRIVQSETFFDEIKALKEKRVISKTSHILNLNPFLDSEGILRVGGRLSQAPLSFNQKHPIILSDKHNFTKLLVKDIHQRTLHGGQQLMIAEARNSYWITNVKRLSKFTVHQCIRCHRYNAKMQEQLMGNLPTERATITRPFTNTGVDYAGPVEIKLWKGRCNKMTKGYIAVFVCLSTKAIHIELVSDLSSAAFIAAFRRFISRRGICTNMFSDCGTNFKGANTELKHDSKFISAEWSTEVQAKLTTFNTTWHFNPPSSPHFGGLWEAGVKSIKHHLKRTIGTARLTFEEYATLLSQIEACLNSRPLCPISSDPDDLSVLTPGHFLIGSSLILLPDRNYSNKNINNLDRWKYLQRLVQNFWKQWSTSYLHLLQQRPKWLQVQPNIKIGDIVLIKEDNLPPSLWLLARVLELHAGADGLTRVVTLKTEKSILKRPIAKLSSLPILEPSESTRLRN